VTSAPFIYHLALQGICLATLLNKLLKECKTNNASLNSWQVKAEQSNNKEVEHHLTMRLKTFKKRS
jgi:hypothetical protein